MCECGKNLFRSESKLIPVVGGPFSEEMKDANIIQLEDRSHGMVELKLGVAAVIHLGHLFHELRGQRYCINSICLNFVGE